MLSRKKGFKKTGARLKPVSDKRKVLNKEYSEARKEYFEKVQGNCEACGAQATDIHHKSKRGKNLSSQQTFMAVCRNCHTRIHDNPAWARELGYLIYEFK